jgi:hypothetical protein
MSTPEIRIPAPRWHGQRPQLTLVKPGQRRFLLSITLPDGTVENLQRTGGHAMDHLVEGIDRGGQVVRVVPLGEAA